MIASNARSATVRRRAPAAAVPTPRRSTAPFGEPRLSSKYPASHKNSFEALPGLADPCYWLLGVEQAQRDDGKASPFAVTPS